MRRIGLPAAIGAVALAAVCASAATGQNPSGFTTSQASMITVVAPAKPTVPIITTGETRPGGYRFESIPDGITFEARGEGRVDVFVNHETSLVPFPFNAPFGGAPPTEANQNDFENSQVSHLALNQHSAGVLSAKYAISSDANYQRFCTSYMATQAEGFDRAIVFANEEAQDWVFRNGAAWPGPTFIAPGTAGAEQAGVTAAYDVRTGKFKTIYGMGRLNHENTVAIPGYDENVVLTTDDTFFTTPLAAPYKPAWSQLYSYIAPDTDALWNDEGDLWAFVSDTPGYDDYFDFAPGDSTVVDGHFIKVPKDVATGKKANGAELLSTDFPGMLPPPAVGGAPPDGPQWVLDQWGNAANNTFGEDVFRFVRLEDVAYDKRPGMSNVVYIADTGRATAGAPAQGVSTNGRVWKFVFDPEDPTKAELSILVEGDNNPVSSTNSALAVNEIHQPDNVETTANGSLFVQEDPGTNNQFSATSSDPNRTTARIWRVDLDAVNPDASKVVAARVDQSTDEGPTDLDAAGRANLGSWESSGIVDVSSVFGPGAYLVTIQAHSLWIAKADGPDVLAPPGKDYTFKREGGQLALIFLDPSW
jgi:hypothetical protein